MPSGRWSRGLLSLTRLRARSLARRRGADHGGATCWPGRGLAGFIPEIHPAGRRELIFFGNHACGDAADVGNFRAAEPKRIVGAGLFLLGRIGLAGSRSGRNRQCGGQHQSRLKRSCSKNQHPLPQRKFGRTVGERVGISKQRRMTEHSPGVAAVDPLSTERRRRDICADGVARYPGRDFVRGV